MAGNATAMVPVDTRPMVQIATEQKISVEPYV